MAKVYFKNENIEIEAEIGTRISDCIRKAGLWLETPCNCMGLCGKCSVVVNGELSPVSEEERKFLRGRNDLRLACFAEVQGDVTVERIGLNTKLRTINRGFSIEAEADGEIYEVRFPEIQKNSCKPYEETIGYKVNSSVVLQKIAKAEKENPKEIYGVVCRDELIDIRTEKRPLLGIALDIGTTGVSAYLVDIQSGEVIGNVSCLNPQAEYGGDVLSRITYSMTEESGTEILQSAIIRMLNDIILELTLERYNPEDLYRIVVAGNTTMLHLFAGVNPCSLAAAPYRPVFLSKREIIAGELGIGINKRGSVILLPSASSYIGADIVSGIVSSDFISRDYTAAFIDIGTNGEIVIIKDGRLMAASTAAGPALEGMNISCGMRAGEGAIDTFSINEEAVSYTTIGDAEPEGICGSGLIDITAALVGKGIILPSGKFNYSLEGEFKERLQDKKFFITDRIYLSQKDIRQIQLAKGAISAGFNMLLAQLEADEDDLKEIVIAGAFGYHLNPESIKCIGLVPKNFKGKITFVGNSSLEGARLALINGSIMKRMDNLRENIDVLELSRMESFQKYFIDALSF